MMRTSLSFVVILNLLAAASPLSAHHSFAAEFDQTKVVMLNGTITVMEWVNPHAMIHLAVKNEDGTVTDWMIEGNTPNSLLRAGNQNRGARLSGEERRPHRQWQRHHVL